MAYFLDLFTPETWHAFRESGATVTGFKKTHRRRVAGSISRGDLFLCYLVGLMRWCGVLAVDSEVYQDDSPIFLDPDPFTSRFRVNPVVTLSPEEAIPIKDDAVWNTLSFTKGHAKNSTTWTGSVRSSLNRISAEDGSYLVELIENQKTKLKSYPLTGNEKRELARIDNAPTPGRKKVQVVVPPKPVVVDPRPASDVRESIKYQAKVAQIGAEMGFHIWVPRTDKSRVLELIPETMRETFLDVLPLNYDDATLRTVEHIDVLWLKGRSMSRAFEIEHTTAIYSGLLRMADLLALQPNMDINLHIVAPTDRQAEVLREIGRPAFSRLERGPLYAQCSYLSYDSIDKLIELPHLSDTKDTIIERYRESTKEWLASV